MSSPTYHSGARNAGGVTSREGMASLLFFSGWAITLLYFPSGLLHFWLGSGVYFRDGLLFLHVAGCVTWLVRNHELKGWARRHWVLFVPAIFVIPALADGGARVEAMTFIKWTVLWADWIVLGRLAGILPGITPPVRVMAGLTVALVLADLIAGSYEQINHAYLFVLKGQVTAFGVGLGREESLGDQLRVKGFQRDVFSFANIMGMGTVAGLWALTNGKSLLLRAPAVVWAVMCASGLLMSGGRSAFFGVFASCAVTAGLLFLPVATRRAYSYLLLGWLVIGLTISFIGVGRLAELVGGSMLDSKGVGNATSAYMRDDNWAGILEAIGRVPVVLIFGSPLSNLLDPKIEPFFHWADNQYLWLLYHTGILGFAAMIWYCRSATLDRRDEVRAPIRDAAILFLLYVMGEAIARESLTFIGCMPFFVAVGAYEAGRADADREERRPPPPPSQRRRRSTTMSDATDFSRRIKAKAEAQQ